MPPHVDHIESDNEEIPLLIHSPARSAPKRILKVKPMLSKMFHAILRQGVLGNALLAAVLGAVCGFIAVVYQTCMEGSIHIFWTLGYDSVFSYLIPESLGWIMILIMPIVISVFVGFSLVFLGFPGDLPNVVKNVNSAGYVPQRQILPMLSVSLFSIAAGGSLGPEAPLVVICSSVASSPLLYLWAEDKDPEPRLLRLYTLVGAAAGLAAFFGVPLGGALFAFEVCHRMGLQNYEPLPYAMVAGLCCLVVFRACLDLGFGSIWIFDSLELTPVSPLDVVIGGAVGVLGVLAFHCFRIFSLGTHRAYIALGLGVFEEHGRTSFQHVYSAVLGAALIGIIGAMNPFTLFWGEIEIGTIVDYAPGKDVKPLPHVAPHTVVAPFFNSYEDMSDFYLGNPFGLCATGLLKLAAIAVTVHSGFRGGFIFPLFLSGITIGLGFHKLLLTWIMPTAMPSAALFGLCVAAALNVAVTRTPLATSLILSALTQAGGPLLVPMMAASYVSLFMTIQYPFIRVQKDRQEHMEIDIFQKESFPNAVAHAA
eukprot:Clim_evm21s252 gene=Clim_evmTU21s252